MKYGKQYLESLENVPEEWRQQAIEYRRVSRARVTKEVSPYRTDTALYAHE
jgi:hypothetical protein